MSRGLYTFELSINRIEEITVEADNLEDAKRKVDLADNEDWEVVYSEGVDLVCVCTPAMRDEIEDAEVIEENADKYQAIKSNNADFFTQKL
jgi:Ran GTPase-activating protein (RanGAP) involved in mRNA processing and transport